MDSEKARRKREKASEDGDAIVHALLGYLHDERRSGGLIGLLNRFRDAGFRHSVDSWVGCETSRPLTPDEIGQVLDPPLIQLLATKAGVSTTTVKNTLAKRLPIVVHVLTPHGHIPSNGLLSRRIARLMGF